MRGVEAFMGREKKKIVAIFSVLICVLLIGDAREMVTNPLTSEYIGYGHRQ